MTPKTFRSLAVALFMGTAAAALAGASAQAAGVRPDVGKPLQAAQAAVAAGNYKAAAADVQKAASVPNLTAAEQKLIGEMRDYVSVKSGGAAGVTSAVGAKAKFAADYRARRYHDVVTDDAQLLRKYGALDAQSEAVIAQAYYLSRDYKGCGRYIAGTFGGNASEDLLQLQMRCAFEAHDDTAMRGALEQLIQRTGKAQYWSQLLDIAQHATALSDPETLDIYRLKLLTGTMKGPDDYFLLTELLLQLGQPDEAVKVAQKGIAAKVLTDARSQRLLKTAQAQAAEFDANLSKTAAAAKTGNALVKLGENYWGMGRGKDAVTAIQAGIKKGVSNAANAQIRLALAYASTGQKPAAQAALAKVKGNANEQMIAHLWALYIRTH